MSIIGNPLTSTNFVTDVFVGDNVTTAFTLSRTPASVTSIIVFIDGVKQASIGGAGAYTLVGTTLNFTGAPPNNAVVEVIHLGVQSLVNVPSSATITASALAPELRAVIADQFTANGTGTTFTLSAPPINSNSVVVTANGVVQYDYSVSGSTLILNFTPVVNTLIRAAGMGNILLTGTITDDSVSSVKLQANSVSTRELTNGAVQANNILDGTITGAKITSTTITGDKIATGQITGNLLTANCVSGNNIVSSPTITGNVTINGSLGIGGATPASSGVGITFPATQSASTDANTLDDYEEGTWTPVIGGDGGESGQSYSGQTGHYTKTGRVVTVNFRVVLSAKGTITGSVVIKGLPFTTQNDINYVAGTSLFASLATNWGSILFTPVAGNTYARVDGVTSPSTGIDTATTSDITNTSQFNGSFTYFV